MAGRAERRRAMRDAGYRRAAGKSGRRSATRVPTLDATALARANAIAALEDAKAEARGRVLARPEGGIVVPTVADVAAVAGHHHP